jgi:TonB family protein
MAVNYEKPSGAASIPAISPARALATPHRDDLEQTLPPTPVRELLAASGASACLLTTDAAFEAVVRQAAGEQYPLSVVEHWPDLKAAVDDEQCGIAILDATLLGDRIFDCIAALGPYAHRLVTLVAADRTTAADLVGLLAERRIHRLLMKPSAVGATRLLIESAVARRLKLSETAANDGALPAGAPAHASRKRIVAVAVAAAALLAAASIAWWQWRERASAPTAAAASTESPAAVSGTSEASAAAEPADPAAQLRRRVDELLAQAELARAEGRLSDAGGTGALELYQAALDLAPDEPLARRGVAVVVDGLFTRAEQALLNSSLDEAAKALDQIRRVEPASTRLAFLDAQLVRALAASAPVAAPPAATPPVERNAAVTELDSTLTLAAARLRRGQLLSPPGDNARDYLERARALDPGSARAAELRGELATALIAAARLIAASDVVAAGALAAEARRQGAEGDELALLEAELAAAQNVASLAKARDLIRQGILFAPPADNALAMLLAAQAQTPNAPALAAGWAEFRAAVGALIDATPGDTDAQALAARLGALRQAPEGAALADRWLAEVAARRLQASYLAEVAPASGLRLVSAPPVAYPEEARANEIEGWVDVEFVVDRTGQTRDGKVIEASRSGTFNAAALAAVASYRYAPFERDGRIYERRVRLRIRFALQ